MNTLAFKTAYEASRNGTDNYYRHAFNRSFLFTDGIRECAEAGCFWLVDMVATEVVAKLKAESLLNEGMLGATYLSVKSTGSEVHLELQAHTRTDTYRRTDEGFAVIWEKRLASDLPEGDYTFILAAQDEVLEGQEHLAVVIMCLMSED